MRSRPPRTVNHHESNCHAQRCDVRIENVPDAKIIEPTDAIIRVTYAGICRSDLWPYRGYQEFGESGIPVGHEAIGVVEVEKDVTYVAESDSDLNNQSDAAYRSKYGRCPQYVAPMVAADPSRIWSAPRDLFYGAVDGNRTRIAGTALSLK